MRAKLLPILLATMSMSISVPVFATTPVKTFWTVNVSATFVKNFGQTGMVITPDSATSPSPANSFWDDSCGNVLYFNRIETGEVSESWLQQEMVRLSNTAAVAGYKVRTAVYKISGDSKCYTSQVQVSK